MHFSGIMLDASIDSIHHETTIHAIKHLQTLSVWNLEQTRIMLNELSGALERNEDQFVITVRDSFPILLTRVEMENLQHDLSEMLGLMNNGE